MDRPERERFNRERFINNTMHEFAEHVLYSRMIRGENGASKTFPLLMDMTVECEGWWPREHDTHEYPVFLIVFKDPQDPNEPPISVMVTLDRGFAFVQETKVGDREVHDEQSTELLGPIADRLSAWHRDHKKRGWTVSVDGMRELYQKVFFE